MTNYDKLVGIPFKHKGRDIKDGVDCWGLVLEVYKQSGIILKDPVPDYPEDWHLTKKENYFLENYHKQWMKLNGVPLHLLDVVLFGGDPEFPVHVGIYIGENKILHSARGKGVVITRMIRLKGKIHSSYRYDYTKRD